MTRQPSGPSALSALATTAAGIARRHRPTSPPPQSAQERSREAPDGHGERNREHAAVPAVQPVVPGYTEVHAGHDPNGGHWVGNRHQRRDQRDRRYRRVRRVPLTERGVGHAAAAQHPVGHFTQLVVYNIPGVTAHLKLTGKVLSEIYQGKITTWNDPPSPRSTRGDVAEHPDRDLAPVRQQR